MVITTLKSVTSGFANDPTVKITYTNPDKGEAFVVIDLCNDPEGGVISGLKLTRKTAERLRECLAEVLSGLA